MARRPANTPTIKDVAERAGVSIGTVSRVLNDFPDVAAPLRLRVEGAVRDLGYRAAARQEPERAHTKAIGFLLCNGTGINTVHAHLLVGIEEYCSSQGYYTIFTRHTHAPETDAERMEVPEILTSRQLADCTIVAGTAHENFLEALEARNARYVLLANHAATAAAVERAANRVRYDDFRGFEEAAGYLAQLGHRNIWYIGDTARPWFRSRHEGYLSGMRQQGLEPRAHTFAIADDPFENGQAIVSYLLEQKSPLSALLCGSEELALGAREALRQHGRDVPRHASVIGFQHQIGHVRASTLTAVCVDTVEVGRQLARMAIALVESGGLEQAEAVVPSTLVKRSTCRPLRSDDAMVL